jgi:pyroglutamyl-peptidase
MAQAPIVVTGFEPFGGETINPSAEVAHALDGTRVAGLRVTAATLPVRAAEFAAHLGAVWALEPQVLLHLGQAGGRAQVAVERVGVNLLDFTAPDNAGQTVRERELVPGGATAHWAALPVAACVAEIRRRGVPAYASLSAGSYLCNAALYLSLDRMASGALSARACGFVHLPYLSVQAAAHGPGMASLSLDQMVEATRAVLEVTVAALNAPPVRRTAP